MEGLRSQSAPVIDHVVVYHGDAEEGVKQPDSFRVCGNGLHFYSRVELPPFELIEFTLDFPSRSGSVDQYCCTGVVAQCQYDCDCKLFQAIVTFLDVPDQARKRIDKLTAAPSSSPPCPSSENC